MFLICVALLSCQKIAKNAEEQQVDVVVVDSANRIDTLCSQLSNREVFTSIQYFDSEKMIRVFKDTNIIAEARYNYFEQVLPVNGIITDADTLVHNYILHEGRLLLVPINEIGNRMYLAVFDLVEGRCLKNELGEDCLISTSIEWYYWDSKKEYIIASNKIYADEQTRIFFYRIENNTIKLVKDELVDLPMDMSVADVKMILEGRK